MNVHNHPKTYLPDPVVQTGMGNKAKLLVVDDEDLLRTSLVKILELYGYSVSFAANATEATEKIDAESFDVLISDLRMPPPGDGFSVIEAMQRTRPSCITLLMSAHFDPATLNGFAVKPDEIIKKPLEIPVLINLIEQKLNRV